MRKYRVLTFALSVFSLVVQSSPQSGPPAGPAASQSGQAIPLPKPEGTAVPSLDEIAALLSGLPGESPSLAAVREMPAWKKFAESLDANWADLEAKRLAPLRAWAETELFDARLSAPLVFYPFGGPDFMTAFELFPGAETYVLLGLEFCGRLPQAAAWTVPQREAYLNNLSTSLSDFFIRSYFITKHMDETLYGQVEGILPIVGVFLKRMGHTILEISRVEFGSAGDATESPYDKAKKAFRPYGVKIKFRAGGSDLIKTILYVSCDLQNKVFTKESPLYLHLDRMASPVTTFVKSASYLLHYADFSNIREMIMAKSGFILQDDTGIPYKNFKPAEWQVRLYGEYAKPIKDFSGVDQPDLQAAYIAGSTIIPKLPFHLGYHWRNGRDALLLIEKRPVPLPTPDAKKK